MAWSDIAWIIVACTSVNHLGLVKAAEDFIRHRLPVVDCPKCLTFWSVLAYSLAFCRDEASVPAILAMSFLAAYAAIWLELLMAGIDTLYDLIYDTLYKDHNEKDADQADEN